MQWIKGSCLCQAVTFEVRNIGDRIGHCHCTMCRKFHGAAYATYGEVLEEDFKWTCDQMNLRSYTAKNKTVRQFCCHCGSALTFHTPKVKGLVEFSLALLDGNVTVKPDAHIFTDYKAGWTSIDDGLPCYREGRDSPLNNDLMRRT